MKLSTQSRWVLALLLAVVAGGVALVLWRGSAPVGLLRPDEVAVVSRGLAVYTQHCVQCHGAQLQGQPNWRARDAAGLLPAPPHDRSGHTWHHTGEVLFNITKHGPQRYAGADYKSAMPAYAGVLSDEDIVAVLSYIKATWPPDVRKLHDGLEAAQARPGK